MSYVTENTVFKGTKALIRSDHADGCIDVMAFNLRREIEVVVISIDCGEEKPVSNVNNASLKVLALE